MKLHNIISSSLCILIFSCLLVSSATADPVIFADSLLVEAEKGSTALLKCRVSNLSSHSVRWKFVPRNQDIFKGSELVSNYPGKYSLISPSDTQSYNLMILAVEESDHGYYTCAVDGTQTSVNIYLQIKGKVQPPFIPPPLNRTDCCVDEGVRSECLPACTPNKLNLTTFDAVNSCEDSNFTSLIGLAKCLTASSNHDNCCLFLKLDPLCLPFCHNEIRDDLQPAHLDRCLNQKSIDILSTCFAHGFDTLPDEPTDVTVLPSTTDQTSSLIVSWKPPKRNADKVKGYKIAYRRQDKKNIFYTELVENQNDNRYRLIKHIVANMGYFVHVAAFTDQGVSTGSVEVEVFIEDESLSQTQNQRISDCCADREVSTVCNSLMCRSRTWSHFNFDAHLQCFGSLLDIFTCLANERDHTPCCQTFGVSSPCQPLCSGNPPPLNDSLINCVREFGIIEACVQQGLDTLPAPPNNLYLHDVTTTTALLSFTKPNGTFQIEQYVVELHKGFDDERMFKSHMTLNAQAESLFLDNLEPNTYYGVRLITEAKVDSQTYGSLPSDTVFFLTYPDSFERPTDPPVINVPHDLKACCEKKGMPKNCSDGCEYVTTITSYYAKRLDECYSHIGSVLSCAADGRDHSRCCADSGVKEPVCLDICRITKSGALSGTAGAKCIAATPIAVKCFKDGIKNLPRHPNVEIANYTWNTISLQWTQPATSGLIDTYIVQYGVNSESERVTVRTNKTQYIMNDLKPGTAYAITVASENENGTSVPSPLIIQYTLTGAEKPNISDPEVGKNLWKNITHCCHNLGLPSECLDLCLNKQIKSQNQSCSQYSPHMLGCYADGQDHSTCCSRDPQLPEVCYSLCSGDTPKSTNPHFISCMSYGSLSTILNCFLENSGLVPEAPSKLAVKAKSGTSVEVVWIRPDAFCNDDCTIDVMYWKPEVRDVQTIKNAESPLVIKKLDTEYFYTFAVRAENIHGRGPPSNTETLYLSAYKRDVKVTLIGDLPYVEVNRDAILQCAASDFNPNDPIMIMWFFNNGRQVTTTGINAHTLAVEDVDPIKDEGTYSCIVTDSSGTHSDSLFLPVKYAPKIERITDDTASPNQGKQAKVACWFKGYPDTSGYLWMKDGKLISNLNDTTKYSPAKDVRYHTGITSYRLKIANVEESDYGVYSIKVANKFGSKSCSVKMQDPDDIVVVKPGLKVFNGTECCAKDGVTELCQDLCGFHVDVAEIVEDVAYITCLAYFDVFVKCGADGRDHTTCCRNKGINSYCLPYCAGRSPGNVVTEQEKMLTCVASSKTIFSCLQSGHKLIPFAPRDVTASWHAAGRNVLVRWNKPIHNYDRIQHYILHYRSGNESQMSHSVNEHIQQYEVKNVNKEKKFCVYVIAANKWGESHPSEVTTLEATALPAPARLDIIVDGSHTVIFWDNSSAMSNLFKSYNIYYAKENAPRLTKISNIVQSRYTLTKLKQKTTYRVYVTTQSNRGHESGPSPRRSFTTGQDSMKEPHSGDDSSDRNVAIAVGVIVAVFAVAAIVFLVIYLMKSRQTHKLTNDTVTFENPGFGNQASVKFQGMQPGDGFGYGRLGEDRVYDSPTDGGERPSSAYENPTYAGEGSSGNTDSNVATLPVNSEA